MTSMRILSAHINPFSNAPVIWVCLRFRMIPFLTELRAVMDWVWTDTTLSLSNWMCVEDIYANIFIIKCSRETEKVAHRAQLMQTIWTTTGVNEA